MKKLVKNYSEPFTMLRCAVIILRFLFVLRRKSSVGSWEWRMPKTTLYDKVNCINEKARFILESARQAWSRLQRAHKHSPGWSVLLGLLPGRWSMPCTLCLPCTHVHSGQTSVPGIPYERSVLARLTIRMRARGNYSEIFELHFKWISAVRPRILVWT